MIKIKVNCIKLLRYSIAVFNIKKAFYKKAKI